MVEAPTSIPAGARTWSGQRALVILMSSAPQGALRRVTIREEATHPDYFVMFGGGSLSLTFLANCATRELQLINYSVYERNNLAGRVVTSSKGAADWMHPTGDSTLSRSIEAACGPRSGPPATAQVASRPSRATTTLVSQPRTAPSLRPALSPTPPPAPAPQGGGNGAVQVAALDSEAAAGKVLAGLKRSLPDLMLNLDTRVERAEVKGSTVYRSLITGFQDSSTAQGFCRTLSARGQACFVRR